MKVVQQLEEDGLIVRKHKLFKPSKHRWPAVEDIELAEDEDDDGDISDDTDASEFEEMVDLGKDEAIAR